MKTHKIEDVERAAWYARLAFGIYQEKSANAVSRQLLCPVWRQL